VSPSENDRGGRGIPPPRVRWADRCAGIWRIRCRNTRTRWARLRLWWWYATHARCPDCHDWVRVAADEWFEHRDSHDHGGRVEAWQQARAHGHMRWWL